MDPLTLGIVVMVGMLVVVMLGLPVGYLSTLESDERRAGA